MTYQLGVIPKFPARVVAGVGIRIDRANAVYTFSTDYNTVPPADIADPGNSYVLVQQPDGSYVKVPLSQVAGAGTTLSFETRLEATATMIASDAEAGPQVIVTYGYTAPGDGGGAAYTRSGSLLPGGFQSADGQYWRLAEQSINVKMTGAKADGVTDDSAAINEAIAVVGNDGGGDVYFPAGRYLVSSAGSGAAAINIALGQDNIRLIGSGSDQTILTKNASTMFVRVSTYASGPVTVQSNTLASNAGVAALTVTLISGKGANFTAGSWCRIISEAPIPGQGPTVTAKTGELICVQSVAGDVLTLTKPLRYAYNTANTAQVQNINWVNGFAIKGIGFDGHGYIVGANVNYDNAIEVNWALQPLFDDIGGYSLPNWFLGLQDTLGATVSDSWARDLLSDGAFGAVGNVGYGVIDLGMVEGTIIDNFYAERIRHAYTTANYNDLYGVPTGARISNGVAKDMRGAGWDTHEMGLAISFDNCATLGSIATGFQIRAAGCQISDCRARDCVASAIYLTADSLKTRLANFSYSNTNTGIYNTFDWTTRAAIFDTGVNNSGEDLTITWTPTLSFATPGDLATVYSAQVGRGIRKGNLFFYWISVTASTFTFTTASGDFLIKGFPFAQVTVAGQTTPGTVYGLGAGYSWPASKTMVVAMIASNEAQARLVGMGTATSLGVFGTANAPTGTAKSVSISGCYEVAALT